MEPFKDLHVEIHENLKYFIQFQSKQQLNVRANGMRAEVVNRTWTEVSIQVGILVKERIAQDVYHQIKDRNETR